MNEQRKREKVIKSLIEDIKMIQLEERYYEQIGKENAKRNNNIRLVDDMYEAVLLLQIQEPQN